MQEPVHVTVRMATVGIPVEVSALHADDAVCCVSYLPKAFIDFLF